MKRRGMTILTGGISIAAGLLIGIFATANLGLLPHLVAGEELPDTVAEKMFIPDMPSLAPIVEKVKPFVVTVTSSRTEGNIVTLEDCTHPTENMIPNLISECEQISYGHRIYTDVRIS